MTVTMMKSTFCLFVTLSYTLAFCPDTPSLKIGAVAMPSFLVLNAAKKRRRKQPPGAPTMPESEEDIDNLTEKDLADIADVSRFEFKPDTFIANNDSGGFGLPGSDPLQLPDIKNQIRKKEMEEEIARMEEEEEERRPRIKRSDKEALAKVGFNRNIRFDQNRRIKLSGV